MRLTRVQRTAFHPGFFVIATLLLGGIAYALLPELPQVPCPFKILTGIPCLTCGASRQVAALLQREVWQAFLLNPLLFLAGALAMLSIVDAGVQLGFQRRIKYSPRGGDGARLRLASIVLIIANWGYLIAAGI